MSTRTGNSVHYPFPTHVSSVAGGLVPAGQKIHQLTHKNVSGSNRRAQTLSGGGGEEGDGSSLLSHVSFRTQLPKKSHPSDRSGRCPEPTRKATLICGLGKKVDCAFPSGSSWPPPLLCRETGLGVRCVHFPTEPGQRIQFLGSAPTLPRSYRANSLPCTPSSARPLVFLILSPLASFCFFLITHFSSPGKHLATGVNFVF